MKKLLLALPIVAGASWAGTAYYAGVQSESAYDQLLSQMGMMEPLVFEKESYEKGLATSHAITAVRESHSPDAAIVFRLEHEINHSPVRVDDNGAQIASATIRTTLSEESDNPKFAQFRELFQGDEPIEIISTAGITGKIDSTINLAALQTSLPFGNGESILNVAESSIKITTVDGRTKGDGTIGAMNLSGVKSRSLTGIEPMNINGVRLGSDSVAANSKVNQNLFFEIDNIDLGSVMPADRAPINSGKVDVKLIDVDATALQNYANWARQRSLKDKLDISDEAETEMLSKLAKLITKDIAFEYNLTLGNAGGSANTTTLMKFNGDDSPTGYDNLVTVADLLNVMEMEISVTADKEAINLTPAAGFVTSPTAQMALVDAGELI